MTAGTTTPASAADSRAEMIAEIEARAKKATSGPWLRGGNDPFYIFAASDSVFGTTSLGMFTRPDDASFARRAREDIPWLLAELRAAQAEIERLAKLIYVPGLLKCKKCGFALIKTNLHVQDGSLSADNSPDRCPNDGSPMWRVSERDAGNEMVDRCEALTAELSKMRAVVDAARKLRSEVGGLEFRKHDFRNLIGDTNYVVLINRAVDVDMAIAAFDATEGKQTP